MNRRKISTAKLLLLGSLVLQCYMLLKAYRNVATLTSDLFEMFHPLGHSYFAAGVMLLVTIMAFASHRTVEEMNFTFVLMALTCLTLYKLLPKYVYYLPLEREIYHTANIVYVYKYYSINVPGYPSVPDSVGYAIFYAVLGHVIGLDSRNFINFLAVFTDLFHLFVVLIISIVIAKRYTRFQGVKLFYILSIPIVFMLQINTTYRNGFGALLFVYTIALLNIFLVKVDEKMLMMLSLMLSASAISYPGLIPLFTIGMLLFLLVYIYHLFVVKLAAGISRENKIKRMKSVFLLLLIGNVAWLTWQIARYPKFFNVMKMYADSLTELFSGHMEIEAFTARTTTYNSTYNLLLMLRSAYAIILLAFVSILALAILLRIKEEKENAILSASLALGFAAMILLGAKGDFHFAAIYNIYSSLSAILISSLLSSNTLNTNFIQRIKSRGRTSSALQAFFAITFCGLTLLSPIALWPAFKNLMPIEAREIEMFKILAEYTAKRVEINYLSLYGDTMGTAIHYVFADRTDITIRNVPYPIDTLPRNIRFLVSSNSIISLESKVKFAKPLHIWFTNFLSRLYTEKMFSKVLDLDHYHEALLKIFNN